MNKTNDHAERGEARFSYIFNLLLLMISIPCLLPLGSRMTLDPSRTMTSNPHEDSRNSAELLNCEDMFAAFQVARIP